MMLSFQVPAFLVFMLCSTVSIFAQGSTQEVNNDTTLANQYFKIAEEFNYIGQHDSAFVYYDKVRLIYEQVAVSTGQSNYWLMLLKSSNGSGYSAWKGAQMELSREILIKTLAIGLEIFGENNLEVAQTYMLVGNYYGDQWDFQKAFDHFQKCLDIRIRILGQVHPEVAYVYGRFGVLYFLKRDYDKCISYDSKAIQILEQSNEMNYAYLSHFYNILGLAYTGKGHYEKGLEYHKRFLNVMLTKFDKNHPEVANCYWNTGLDYFMKGDYDTALEYYHRSVALYISTFGNQYHRVGDLYNRIGEAYYAKKDFQLAISNFERARSIFDKLTGEHSNQKSETYANLGKALAGIQQYDSALEHFVKSIDAFYHFYDDGAEIGEKLENIAMVYSKNGDLEKAEEYYMKSLSKLINFLGPQHPTVARVYRRLGDLFLSEGYFDRAIRYAQKSFIANVVDFTDTTRYHNPDLEMLRADIELLESLKLKGRAFERRYSLHSNDVQDLEIALSTYELAIFLADQIRVGYHAEGSKLYFSSEAHQLYVNGIQTAHMLNDIGGTTSAIEKLFLFSEKSKATMLSQSLQESLARQFSSISSDLIKKEGDLRIDLAYYDTEIQKENLKKEDKDKSKVSDYESRFFSLKREYEDLVEQLEESFPDYHNMKYKTATVTIPELQEVMSRETAVLEYFIGKDNIYIYVITTDLSQVFTQELDDRFGQTLSAFVSSFKSLSGREDYLKTASRLHEILISPVMGAIADKKHLVIIPDGDLYQIPFEALLSVSPKNEMDYTSWDFLIRKYAISYHYSATLFANSIKRSRRSNYKQDFVAFAPVFSDSKQNGLLRFADQDSAAQAWVPVIKPENQVYLVTRDGKRLDELKYSADEVLNISRLFSSRKRTTQLYLHEKASEENFKSGIAQAKYVHVATHGFIQSEYPKLSNLAFSQPREVQPAEDGILYSSETFNLNLASDLLVLSACQSGIGKIAKGEGLMALTRGFLYSGAHNIIASLWKVFDQHTSMMMVEFYRQILQGKSYSIALREAKLKMIDDPTTAGPQSWAAFVLVGQ